MNKISIILALAAICAPYIEASTCRSLIYILVFAARFALYICVCAEIRALYKLTRAELALVSVSPLAPAGALTDAAAPEPTEAPFPPEAERTGLSPAALRSATSH